MMTSKSIKKAISEISRKLGPDAVATEPELLTCYAFDATNMRSLPAAVAFPASTEQVQLIVAVCGRFGVLVVPRGAGTGFAGGTVPVGGGVVISTEKLNRILSVDKVEKRAIVQSGVVNGHLQKEVAKVNLMFPPDPSSLEVSTIGGNAALDAGGPRALKYGVTRDYVLGVEFVTWDGRILEPVDLSNGWKRWDPVTTLMVGSEGTLGVMTKLWLKLLQRPLAFRTALVFFKTAIAAAEAVSRVLGSGVLPAAVELMDGQTMDCVRRFVDVKIPGTAGCSLLVETDGADEEAEEAMSTVKHAVGREGVIDLRTARSEADREDLWRLRRSISPSLARIASGKINEDVCVPRSKLPLLVEVVGRLAQKYDLTVPTFGHAGDGNLHVNVMLDKRDRDAMRRAEALVTELFRATIDLDGTISGEHGIGVTKREYLPDQLGPHGLRIQNRIKQSFDPHSLINPGKVISQT